MKDIKKYLREIRMIFQVEKSLMIKTEKIILAEIVLRLRKRYKRKIGLFIILGWQKKWNKKYFILPDASQDIFMRRKITIFQFKKSLKKIAATVNFDGAILIDHQGRILHSGIIISGLNLHRLAEKVGLVDGQTDFSTRLGFKKKVHTRHLAAIAASYELSGTTVYTLSEENGDVRIYEKGKIIFSTVKGE